MSMTIGSRIASIRNAWGWTQLELSERVGVAVAVISHWETGHRTPSLGHAIKLARALGVSLDRLCGIASI